MEETNNISVESIATAAAVMGANDASLMIAIFASQGEKTKIYVLLAIVAVAASLFAVNLRLNYWSIALACLAWAASVYALYLSARAMSGAAGAVQCWRDYSGWPPYLAHGSADKADAVGSFLAGIDSRNADIFQTVNTRGLSMRSAKNALVVSYGILLLSVNPAFFLF